MWNASFRFSAFRNIKLCVCASLKENMSLPEHENMKSDVSDVSERLNMPLIHARETM